MVSDFCVWVAGHVVQKLFDSLHCFLSWVGLLSGNFAECHEDGDVDSAAIIEEAPHNLLDSALPFFIKFFTVIFGRSLL